MIYRTTIFFSLNCVTANIGRFHPTNKFSRVLDATGITNNRGNALVWQKATIKCHGTLALNCIIVVPAILTFHKMDRYSKLIWSHRWPCHFFNGLKFGVLIVVVHLLYGVVAKPRPDITQAPGAVIDVKVMAYEEIQAIVPMNRMRIMIVIERQITNGPITAASFECNSGVIETAIDSTIKGFR